MKKIYWILIIVGVLFFLWIMLPLLLGKSKDKDNTCYYESIKDCDRSCSVSSDCKFEPCSYCINKNQNFSYGSAAPSCIYLNVNGGGNCECLNKRCEFVLPLPMPNVSS